MFRIGEFSKVAQVSGRLLRYYDEIGLLCPEFTDPDTGYRYYSARQLSRLNRILVLKELGLSLEQVARLLGQETSAAEIRGMLALRKAQIEQTLQEELERLRVVETRLQQLDASGQMQEPDVVLKSVPAQPFLGLREVLNGMEAVKRRVQQLYRLTRAALNPSSLGHMTVVVHSPIFDPEALDLEIGFLLTGKAPASLRLSETQELLRHELPAVETMATLLHLGRVDDTHRTYGVLAGWVEANQWQFVGTGREILMQLPFQSDDGQAVFEIQLPVKRNGVRIKA